MTDTVDKSIDEILRYFRGWVSLAGNSGEPMYKLGEYEQGELDEAKQAIKDLILDIIGDDDKQVRGSTQNPDNPAHHTKRTKFRNELRAEQRGRL